MKIQKKYFSWLFFLLFVASCATSNEINKTDTIVKFSILYTSDEHGWIEKYADFPGASSLLYNWQQLGIDLDNEALILSGGDNWTGPVISNYFTGKSTIAVLNKMGYDAITIGNHEFDFSGDTLLSQLRLTEYPVIASNISYNGNSPYSFTIKPYVIKEIKGLKVGIIGLANLESEELNFPKNLEGFKFSEYVTAISDAANNAKKDGASILVVISHLCKEDIIKLTELSKNLGITAFFGGHCHNITNETINDVKVIEAGNHFKNYAKVDFSFDKNSKKIININSNIFSNNPTGSIETIDSIVYHFKKIVNDKVSEVIGYTDAIIRQKSNEMANMILDSWLIKYPQADVALANSGGIRSSIAEGNITTETIMGLLPFDNNLILLNLTGAQLVECLDDLNIGGLNIIDGYKLTNNKVWHLDSTYKVMTMDYLYEQKGSKFKQYDSNPEIFYVNYREPLIEWLKSIKSSKDNPINKYLDPRPRK